MSDDMQEIYIDGVANVNLSYGSFRFDLVTVQAPVAGKESEAPELKQHARVIMSPQGYLQMVTALQNFLGQVEEKGIIRREAVEGAQDMRAEESTLRKGKK